MELKDNVNTRVSADCQSHSVINSRVKTSYQYIQLLGVNCPYLGRLRYSESNQPERFPHSSLAGDPVCKYNWAAHNRKKHSLTTGCPDGGRRLIT